MLVMPTGESFLERPSLDKNLELLWGSERMCSGSSIFDGGTKSVVVLSLWSEYLNVTQYTTIALMMT
jgi:hypothetical protein